MLPCFFGNAPHISFISFRLIPTSHLYGFSSLFVFCYVFCSSDRRSLVCFNHTLVILEWAFSMFSDPFVPLTYTILVGSSISASPKHFGPSPMEVDNRETMTEWVPDS